MWEPRCLTTLWASTACYRDSFTFLFVLRPLASFPIRIHLDLCISGTAGAAIWTGDSPVVKPLPTYVSTNTKETRTDKHPCLEWDSNPRSLCFENKKTFYALGRAGAVIASLITEVTKSRSIRCTEKVGRVGQSEKKNLTRRGETIFFVGY
jgi:hypothetical protein